MAAGEIAVSCAQCGHRLSLPVAAIKRDNFYCPRCFQKIPLAGVRTISDDARSQPAQPKKSSRTSRRY